MHREKRNTVVQLGSSGDGQRRHTHGDIKKQPGASCRAALAFTSMAYSWVDRPEIVVSTGPNQVQLDEFNRWASPLQNSMARAIAENLVAMLGTPRVALFPQALSADADYRVAIEVQGFRSAPGEAAVLDAVWTVRRAQDGRTETRRTSVREAVQENGYDALAAAHSRALARLSRDIADAVRALDRSGQ